MLLPPLKIGDLALPSPLIIAPMAGVTDYPFRVVARQFGAGLVFCEFVSAEGVVRERKSFDRRLNIRAHERPIGIQIFGSRPETMARCAADLIAEFQPDVLDINFGCPVPKIANKGGGAAALKDLGLMRAIVCAVVEAAGDVPVTVKMRAGWDADSILVPDVGPMLQACGIKALTLHPRTGECRYAIPADWRLIAELKQAMSIPVIGNGDVRNVADLVAMVERTGCDGVMVGRAVMGNPWMIRSLNARMLGQPEPPAPTVEERLTVCAQHLALELEEMGERTGLNRMRKQFAWYLNGSLKTRPLVDRMVRIPSPAEAFELLNKGA